MEIFKIILGIGIFLISPYLESYPITKKSLENHVIFLTSKNLEGRLTGSNGEKKATDYVAHLFQEWGLLPGGDQGTFFQAFGKGRNVVGKLKIISYDDAPLIVVGAHVDHLGRGESKEKHIYPGADDNASGVASVLEAAAFLSHLNAQGKLQGNKNILFVIWSGEELGLLGSTYFTKHFIPTNGKSFHSAIVTYVNLDMVGRFKKNLVIQGIDSSPQWKEIIAKANKKINLPLITQRDPYLPTDSLSFYLQGVPAINFFTGAHLDYHAPSDEWYKLNFDSMKNITEFLVSVILTIESEKNTIDYQTIKKTEHFGQRHFKVYLGTIPDYTFDAIGVKLAGVIKNSPADIAGLKADDVIIQFEKQPIHDLYDYSNCLHSIRANKRISLVVLRGHKKVVLSVVPLSRQSILDTA